MHLNLKTKKTSNHNKPPKKQNWHNWGLFYEYLEEIKWTD